MSKQKPKIAIIGSGSWGTTLAVLLCSNREKVWLWARPPADAKQTSILSRQLFSKPASLTNHANRSIIYRLCVDSRTDRKAIEATGDLNGQAY